MSNPSSKLHISIIGSTGCIGRQTLEVISEYPKRFKVSALACYQEIDLLEEQIKMFNPEVVAVFSKQAAQKLRERLQAKKIKGVKVLEGLQGWITIATYSKTDMVVAATKGVLGLKPLISAIKAKKKIALANKEVLVTEGFTIMNLVKKYKISLIPIDSEHSALFQVLQGENPKNIEKVMITCSGGPFYFDKTKNLEKIKVKEALSHPVWNMGKKISVDSATLMNKGFEIIGARHLFNLSARQIEILIHPEGIVHALVQFKDGAIKAVLAPPDMRFPITYALFYPERVETAWPRLNFETLRHLNFYPPDFSIFRGPRFAYDILEKDSRYAHALVKANDQAVEKFLKGEIPFLAIYKTIQEALKRIDK